MRNVLLVYDDNSLDSAVVAGAAKEWARSKGNGTEVEVLEIYPWSSELALNDLVSSELHKASTKDNPIINLAVVSGGSSFENKFASFQGLYNRGFIDVLEGLRDFLSKSGCLNLFVALRSKWIETTGEITDRTKSFDLASLTRLLKSLPTMKLGDFQNNHQEISNATKAAAKAAPNEIFTISKADKRSGCLNGPEIDGLFDFFDKAFIKKR